VKKLRDALEDLADQPRFIETLPRRGYRFYLPVVGEPIATDVPQPAAWRVRVGFVGSLGIVAMLASC